jgi:hypothetical protein
MKKISAYLRLGFLFYCLICSYGRLFAQPDEFAGDINGWSVQNMENRNNVMAIRYMSSTSTNSGFKFKADGTWNPQWCGSGADFSRSLNSRLSGAAYIATGSGGWEHNLEISATNGNYYTFIIGKNTSSNNDISILETSYNPRTITTVARTPNTPNNTQSVTVTATLSGTLNTGEYVFIRYTTDAWVSSSLVSMAFVDGSDYSASIPAQTTGTTVSYYILTSNSNSFSSTDADYFSLEINNNAGPNYSYTVAEVYTTAQNGDWNTASTWTCNCIPPTNAATQINHTITVNATVANNPSNVEITPGNSIAFGALGDLTVNSSLTNNGSVDMTSGGILRIANNGIFANNATFTGGAGEVFFPGTGTVQGTVTFNDVSIAGGVNFGANASVNGILQIYGGGWLNSNAVVYNVGSTLRYAGNYTVNSTDQSWYSNNPSLGSPQKGVPWNVEIESGYLLQLNDSYQFDMNGSLLIDGTFRLGNDGGSHWGDLALRGDFILNIGATFNNNSRSVKFIGTALQTISGTQSPTFAYLEVNNAFNLNLSQTITVNTQVTFTNGKIELGNNNVNAGSAVISSYDSGKYFVTSGSGYLVRTVGNSETVFPVGNTTIYAPAYLTQAGTQEDLYVRVKQGIDNATANNDFAVNLQWTIDEQTPGSNSITTKFQWNVSDENLYFDRNAPLKIGRFILSTYTTSDASLSGSGPYTASASGMADNISAEIPFIVGNTMAFSASGYQTAQNGNWTNGSTWVGGVVPPAGAVCAILHHVSINSAITDFPSELTIYPSKSLTFLTNGSLTVNGTVINNGMLKTDAANASLTISGTLKNVSTGSLNMVGGGILYFSNTSILNNSGSFTAGAGTVEFQGNGTATGDLTFNNLNIAGNVDLGANAKLNNTLTLTASGNLITNSITYLEGSLLKFDRNFSLGEMMLWYRNVDASGTAQTGIPWNVEVAATRLLDIGDAFFRAMNGNLTLNGSFAFSSSAGGDFKIRGNFINNGSLTHNSRQISFYGNNNQKISGSTPTTFAYMVINNNSNVTLETACTLVNMLTLSNGKLILGNNNFSVSTGGSISGYDASKYIVTNGTGYLIQNINVSSTAVYPVGTLTGYNRADLSQGASATQDDIGVRVIKSIDNSVNDPTQIVNVQWTLNEAVADGNNLTTKFYWFTTDEASGFNRGGTVQTRYWSSSWLPASPIASIIAGTDPWDATAGDVYNLNLAGVPFIVANSGAFSGGIFTIANGNWSAPATWNGGVPPTTGQCGIIYHDVSLDLSPTVKAISIASGGTLNCATQTLTLDNGGAISNSGTYNAGTGKVIFSGAASISTGSIIFNDVDINGAVSFGSNSTIAGILNINTGGSVNINPPKYDLASTLNYRQGGSVMRGYEWLYNISPGDPGYPSNVQISNSTTLDIDADDNDDNFYQTRYIGGDLTVDALSTIALGNMGGGTTEALICGLYVKGNILNNGTIILSSANGGDLLLEGDITNTGTIAWNSRALFFTGSAGTSQNVLGISQIPFILITSGSTVVLQNDLEVNGSGIEFITFARPSSIYTGKVNLNGHNLTCDGTGNIELNNLPGAEVIGTGRVVVSAGNATYSGTGSGTLSFAPGVTLAINGGIMTFPSSLGIVTIYGTLEVGDGATITNIPTYGDNSTLHYVRGGAFTMGPEWPAGSDMADNIPFNVTVSQGSTPAVLNMNAGRYALGEMTIEQFATLEVAFATGQLTVNDLTVDLNGKIVLKSPNDNSVAGSLITFGNVSNSGTMQAERFVSGGKYTYVSPPNDVTSSSLFTDNPNGYFNPNFYSYDQSFDANPNPDNELYSEWDENNFNDAWLEAHNNIYGSGIILSDPGIGYAYYNDMDRFFVFDGTFNAGNQSVNLYYNDNDVNNGYFDGWNLIANPFPSALNWDYSGWDKTYVDAAIYYWDGTSSNIGNYKYYVATTDDYSDGTNVVNGGSQFIPSSQAFFVKAKTIAGETGQSFIIPNNARFHNNQEFWGKETPQNKKVKASDAFIRLKATANNATDELVVRYIPEATPEYDSDYDAYKMYSDASDVPQIYSYNTINGAGFAINSRPIASINETIPIGIEIGKAGPSECVIELTDYKYNNSHIYFQDTQEGINHNLSSVKLYQFIIPDSSDSRGRFNILFEENTAPVLNGNLSDYSGDYGTELIYSIDQNVFQDSNTGDVLSFSAQLSDNQPLLHWLKFDQKSATFYGSPDQAQFLEITVTASDIFGASVSDVFSISINAVLAEVSTDQIIQVTDEAAVITGSIISSGGTVIDEAGICWSTEQNPTIDDDFTVSSIENDHFIGLADDLLPNTTYFVRSYAVNMVGVSYGNELSFSTLVSAIPKLSDNEISLYPNPVDNILYLWTDKSDLVEITILNIQGKAVKSTQSSNSNALQINVSSLSPGIYFIEIQTISSVLIKKFLKI